MVMFQRLVMVALLGLSACADFNERDRLEREGVARAEVRYRREGCAKSLAFFRDEKTGLCFAFCYTGGYSGGPGLSLVPDFACEPPTKKE